MRLSCVSGCGQQKLETHLFFTCPLFGQLWELVRKWLCVYSANPSNILDHFYQFGTYASIGKFQYSLMHFIWFASSLVI